MTAIHISTFLLIFVSLCLVPFASAHYIYRINGTASIFALKTVTSEPIEDAIQFGPFFERTSPTHVTTRAGQTAVLKCVVKNLGNRQVSWIRGRDLHILSLNLVVFASDSRLSVTRPTDQDLILTVRYAQPEDSGPYTCQVNTEPPIAQHFNLSVIEARAVMQGKRTLYVQEGSNVSLECVIKEELVIPGLVLWYQGDALVPRDSARIRVDTQVSNVTASSLSITGVLLGDSGNYSCWPSAGKPDSVLVHVIKGQLPAAMQHGEATVVQSPLMYFAFVVLFCSYLSYNWSDCA